ncbi:MAG TPA: aldehyde dehydrogenase family protein [Streptosporangiaceae bacterium]|nr:aldehyde dehydrogenase family protein [Streptosporangiaceae bacterium]
MSVPSVAGVSVDPRHWIGGRRVASGDTFTDVSPIGEQPVARVARGGASEVSAAVRAPLTASLLAGITREAGLPDGVFNVVQGLGSEAGAALAGHPGLSRLAFTGSAATGRLVAAAAGSQLTPVSLELGGKSPLLVFADADLDLAVRHAAGQFDNAGQVCLAGTRLLVSADIAPEFTARFVRRPAALRQGDPRDDTTGIGPNITRQHLDRVDGYVRRAIVAGAHPVLGGGRNTGLGGLYYQPTLLTGAEPGAEILTEEVFGPALTLQTFRCEDEAVEMANATPYGLAATVFTGDERRAGRVSGRLRAGTVWVNCFFVRDLAAPFGGSGLSGIGREGGTWSFDFYSDLKNTVYAPEGWQRDG